LHGKIIHYEEHKDTKKSSCKSTIENSLLDDADFPSCSLAFVVNRMEEVMSAEKYNGCRGPHGKGPQQTQARPDRHSHRPRQPRHGRFPACEAYVSGSNQADRERGAPEPQQLVIRPFDPGTIKDIEKGIIASDLSPPRKATAR
jgi:hypothetical protein